MKLLPDEDEDIQQGDSGFAIPLDDTETEEKSISIEPINPPKEKE